jgi:hypothetical protein
MRCVLSVLLVACVAAVASAGPLDKNAGSKINGDMIGTPAAAPVYQANANPGTANRSFSYAPAPAQAQVAQAPRTAQAVPAPPVQRTSPQMRRYSYQPMQQPVYRNQQTWQTPSYLHPDRKARFQYH